VVMGLERPRQELVGVALHLEGAHVALQLGADAGLRDRVEPPAGDLLAGVDPLGRELVGDLLRVGDGARDDRPLQHLLRGEVVPREDVSG